MFLHRVFSKDSEKFVAQVYVGPVNRDVPEFQIGFVVDRDHQGHGYVSEAVRATLGFVFHDPGAHGVRLECDDTNVRSWRVAERCGLIKEGHIRDNRRNADSTLSETQYYWRLRREFERQDR